MWTIAASGGTVRPMSEPVSWLRRKLRRRAAVIAGLCSLAGASVQAGLVVALVGPVPWWLAAASVVGSGIAGAVVAAFIVERYVARRLRAVSAVVETADARDLLLRLPVSGEDELADATKGLNQLLARLTSLQVSVLEQSRELSATKDELDIEKKLAAKSAELEQRLGERRLLFELLRVGVTANDVDDVLRAIATRVGEAMRMRETALFIREAERRFTVRAVHGFANPHRVLGRTLEQGEGITGEAARIGEPIVIRDVSADERYLAFWGEVAREGSFAAFPIVHQETRIGFLAVTRPPGKELTDIDTRLLAALADQAALAIRHTQLIEELRALSTTDELTRLPNRRVLAARLDHELDRADRFGKPVSVVLLDVDHFHDYNEKHGHPGGDAALKLLADALRETVRRVDTVARVGGEEFVALLPETPSDEATLVAEKLRLAVAAKGPPGEQVTISLGVATRLPAESAASLLARADQALFAAKNAGRNRVVVAGATTKAPESAQHADPSRSL